ncbi:MAG: 3-phosphoglycerate dehydrogenase [Rhizobiaceae bacterium]|nr:3-phosphoglycerate dehydrogenase [Rhizobiaceae bacterium]
MAEIIVTEFMDEAAVDRMGVNHDCIYDPSLVDNPEKLIELLPDARALVVRNRTQVRGDLLEAGGKLECVGRLGVGLDNIDVEACTARGIDVYPATGANDLSVAEYVITTAQALLRDAYLGSASVIAGDWPRTSMIGREMSGRVMGLIGYGSIAREVASRAQAMGMTTAAYDPYLPAGDAAWGNTSNMSLEKLAAVADIISLHVPLTDSTRHLVNAEFLKSMKSDAIVINAARGGVVDDTALAAAIAAGEIGGGALDVFETEPLTAEAGHKFANLNNFIATPHIAGVTAESNIRVSHLIADKVLEKLTVTS